jgi:hypothetical protein
MHGHKVLHTIMIFHIVYTFLKAEAELGPGEKQVYEREAQAWGVCSALHVSVHESVRM